MMDGAMLTGLAAQVLGQDMDLSFGFEAASAPGAFVVRSFSGVEELFEGYEITVDLVSDRGDIALADLLDTPAYLGIYHKYDQPRFLHGQITEIEKKGAGHFRTFYRTTLKPVLHRLQYHSDARIFQEQSVVDISKTVLADNGVIDVDWRIEGDHKSREYCVQYGESSYDFIRRIWAEEGLFFWFEHTATAHKMIVSDAPLAMPMLAAAESLTYNNTPGGTAKGFWVSQFDQIERLRATNRVSRDYHFKKPAYHQQHAATQYASNGAKGQYELYHYPGRHKTPDAGQPFNDHALEAHRVEATTAEGETNNIQFSAGFTFGLTDHDDAAANTTHRLLQVIHEGHQPAALQEDAPEGDATTYTAQFTSQPARLPYRPLNPNPKPMVEGPQIAHVTGPEGEEIYCDEHGRVKVWFPWDRHGQKNEHSSCWIRVAQNWAGGTWGHMAIPRIGHEVVVDFLGGDPDQPIITGRTYHATNKPPYPLPEHKTKMIIRSDTHKGTGFNELSFEDENDREKIYLHAEKDHELHIENNRAKRVDRNQSESVGNNKSIEVGNNHHEVIGGNMTLMVGPNKLQSMVTSAFKKFTSSLGELSNKLGVPDALNMGEGNLIIGVAKNKAETVMMASNEIVGAAKATTIGGGYQVTVGGVKNESVAIGSWEEIGNNKVSIVGEKYELVCGKSKLTMHRDGNITLEGENVVINGKSKLAHKGGRIDLN